MFVMDFVTYNDLINLTSHNKKKKQKKVNLEEEKTP